MILELSPGKKIYILHRVSPLSVALSIKHLATMLKSGLPLEEVLSILATQNIDPKLSDTYEQILQSVRSGKTLAESFKEHKDIFSDIIISIVDIGEQGATLEKNLVFLSEYLKKAFELSKKIKGALIYPVIVLVVTLSEMLGVAFFVLPRLEGLFGSFENPPAATVAIINFTKNVRENIGAVVVGLAVIIFLIRLFLKSDTGKRFKDVVSLKFPVFKNLTKNNILSSFSRTLGILLESGIPLSEALLITSDTTPNSVYKKILKEVNDYVKSGHTLAEALLKHPKHFPNTYVKMIEVGESTGTLEENLLYLHEFYTEELEEMSANLTTLLEPMLMILIGVMIGGLALLVILPIYQLVGTINQG